MVRLMLTLAPIACILSGIGMSEILITFSAMMKSSLLVRWKSIRGQNDVDKNEYTPPTLSLSLFSIVITGATILLLTFSYHATYVSSIAYSSPSIVIDAGKTPDGRRILFDDYREAYFWLRQNTDPDAKILSWWDYGYQMSAMANRTVLVDNNTWNNTHIATVGRALASTEG